MDLVVVERSSELWRTRHPKSFDGQRMAYFWTKLVFVGRRMLKKSLFSPTQPLVRQDAPFTRLRSRRTQRLTYRSVRLASSLAAALPAERSVPARRGRAGKNHGLFEHPETILASAPYLRFHQCIRY